MIPRKISVLLAIAVAFWQMGCIPCEYNPYCISGTAGDQEGEPQAPVTYPLTQETYTTLQNVWVPREPSAAVREAIENGEFSVYEHTAYEENGLGADLEAGIAWIEHSELAPDFAEGEADQQKSLAYIWMVGDPQLIDEESPIRMDGYEKVYRPHGQLSPQVFEAHVRTAKRISDSGSRPFDFAILAGDITDTSQKNELDWVLTILNGGVVDPDSGIDNDPDPGPGNDYNDPFISDSLNTPWYPALGNHDVLYIGGFGVNNDLIREAAVDDHLFTRTIFNLFRWHGYVAGDTLDGDIVLSPFIITPPDNDRVPLNQAELLQTFHDAGGEPQGHGFTQNDVAAGKGYYSVYPVPGKPIKMLVLDTTDSTLSNMTIAFQGSMDKEQFGWLEQELTLADDNRELVIVVSHHRLEDFHIQSPVLPFKLRCLLSSYENVILHLAGHGHKNTKELQRSIFNDHGYWELMTASTGDFPMQSRIIELVDEGNGFLSIYVTNVGHNSPEDSLAHKARQLAAGKLAFGDTFGDGNTETFWDTDTQAQNLLLRLKLTDDVRDNLTLFTWPSNIESVETLAGF